MSLTSSDFETQVFTERFRGYDPEEVDAFLDRVATRFVELEERIVELEERCVELEEERDLALQRAEQGTPAPAEAEQAASTSETENVLRRTLIMAERTAEATVAEARAEAEQMREDARIEAGETIQSANEEAARTRDEANIAASAAWSAASDAAARVRQAVAEIRAFHEDYRDRVEAVISEQFAYLDRVELPDLPESVEQLGQLDIDEEAAAWGF